MELKLHLYSITSVTSILKPEDPESGTWNPSVELGRWHLEHGTWMLKLEETGHTGSASPGCPDLPWPCFAH